MIAYSVRKSTEVRIAMFSTRISAGKPFPVEGETEEWVDLNELLIARPETTYLVPVSGDSMEEDIKDGDYLVVDRALDPQPGKVAVFEIDGDFTVKRLTTIGKVLWLVPDNDNHRSIELAADRCGFWGTVTHVIHRY